MIKGNHLFMSRKHTKRIIPPFICESPQIIILSVIFLEYNQDKSCRIFFLRLSCRRNSLKCMIRKYLQLLAILSKNYITELTPPKNRLISRKRLISLSTQMQILSSVSISEHKIKLSPSLTNEIFPRRSRSERYTHLSQ